MYVIRTNCNKFIIVGDKEVMGMDLEAGTHAHIFLRTEVGDPHTDKARAIFRALGAKLFNAR